MFISMYSITQTRGRLMLKESSIVPPHDSLVRLEKLCNNVKSFGGQKCQIIPIHVEQYVFGIP